MLDGVAARLVRSASEFGGELDSLCDAVTFGVAPAYMLYMAFFRELGDMGIFFASLPAIAGVTRLARFNVQLVSFEDKRYFTGLPIPASALTIISYLMFYHHSDLIPEEYKIFTIFAVTIVTSAVMVSRIKYDNIPRPTPAYIKSSPILFSVAFIAVIASIVTKGKFIFPFMVVYIIFSAIRHFIRWIFTKESPVDEMDENLSDEDIEDDHDNS
jgi:CDP-diacylglycerol--serine O-phosphatidyltransferase